MNLYLLTQDKVLGFEVYVSAVVCAESEEEAKTIHPSGDDIIVGTHSIEWGDDEWPEDLEDIQAKLIGTAAANIKKGVVHYYFHHG